MATLYHPMILREMRSCASKFNVSLFQKGGREGGGGAFEVDLIEVLRSLGTFHLSQLLGSVEVLTAGLNWRTVSQVLVYLIRYLAHSCMLIATNDLPLPGNRM